MKSKLANFLRKDIYVLSGLFLTVSILVTLTAMALGRYTIVFFYADWNLNCREAKPVIEAVAGTYNNARLQEINIDKPTAPAQARALGLNLPRAIPQISVLDSNGKIAAEFNYSGESSQQVKARLDSVILK